MPGRGPAPKPAARRARRNAEPSPLRSIEIEPAQQPKLETVLGEENPATGEPWSAATLALWDRLGEAPSTRDLVDAQWALLARAMVLDDLVMRGEVKHASEVRLQLAKFFVAPDDMLRGRIQVIAADEAEQSGTTREASSARDRSRGRKLRAV